MKLDYRLALDLGTNSIGWCIYKVARDSADHEDERWKIVAIQRMGVRIFSDGRNPKDLTSLAASRRGARQARRRRDRALQRKYQLLNQLIELGLLPTDTTERKALTSLDPYVLRAKGLSEKLPPHHLGRALFHLARKRGFRSGRKDLQTEESAKESGKIDSGIKALRAKLAENGYATVGQYLAQLHTRREPVLARPGSDGSYPIYLSRELVAEEFDKLWQAQSAFHPQVLNSSARERLRHTILFQRKLLPVKPGKCLYEKDQPRALLAHPLSQRFRILQELSNLAIHITPSQQRGLTLEERNLLLEKLTFGDEDLSARGELTWSRLKVILKLPKQTEFNLNTSGRKGLKADMVSILLSQHDAIGKDWRAWSAEQQDDFLLRIRKADRRIELNELLEGFKFSQLQLDNIFRVAGRMPDDFGSISIVALKKIVPALEAGVIHYNEAVQKAGYGHHSIFYSGEFWEKLPYYGQILERYTQPRDIPSATPEEREYGRIANPTVHVGLNQLRRVVNAIIARYGHPKQIIIELARELGLSGENRRKLEKEQNTNRERNEKYDAELTTLGQKRSRENRQRLQLFDELTNSDPLGIECVYAGERISKSKLFSDEIEIDHILPFSRSLDDGIGNKVLCTRKANRDKKDRTPFEAFGDSPKGYVWQDILSRAERLIPHKAKRFREGALNDFLKDNDFLARHLNDTAYFSKVAREYLTSICPPNCIWVSTGRLTSMLRGKWRLNEILNDENKKTRNYHRHHAVDAAVIGACDRSLIKAMATAARRAEDHGESRLLEGLSTPWATFLADIKATVEKVVISHKPDHSLTGALHNETIYGILEEADAKGRSLVVHRAPVSSIAKRADLESVVDNSLRSKLLSLTEGMDGKTLKAALLDFSDRTGIQRLRVSERLSVQAIPNPGRSEPRHIKTDGNYCYEVIRDEKGKWSGYAVSLFEANRIKKFSRTHGIHGDRLLMRLIADDCIASSTDDGKIKFYRVVKLSNSGVVLAEHFEAGSLKKRDADSTDSFKYLYLSAKSLQELQSRPVFIDELGYVNDPGFKE